MKIIELAEKQKNNEILPKHIRYEDKDLYFDGVTYYDKEGNNDLFDILAMNNNALTHLYDEIEIIEDIEKGGRMIEKIRQFCEYPCSDKYECWSIKEDILVNKINEIIDVVNELKESRGNE